MALTSAGFWLSVTLVDNGNNETTKRYQLNSADADAAATDSATVLAALAGVTDAVVRSYFFYENFVEGSFAFPAAGVQIENQALLDFNIVGHPEKTATLTIPAPKPAIFVDTSGAGANVVDTSDAALITYRDLFRTGGVAYISDGEVANSLVRGRRIHRHSLRG